MKSIRVAIISADQLVRDCLRHSLPGLDARFLCVDDFPFSTGVADTCREIDPDLVIVEVNGRCAMELTVLRELASQDGWALLVIAGQVPEHMLDTLITRKRSGFFSRCSRLEALAQAAFLIAVGGTYFDSGMQALLMRRAGRAMENPELSQRERHVLQLVAEGHSTKEVAVILRISVKTADKYRTSLMQKIGVRDVVRLTHYAIRMGFVTVS